MILQKQPNRWSCLPTSFAMALDISVEPFINRIGHDGSPRVWDNLPEPKCRRGFHIHGCIEVADRLGKSVTPFELVPMHAPTMSVEPIRVTFTDNLARFKRVISASRGVITCLGHAVAYENGVIYDPAGRMQPFDLGINPICAWRIA
jgi:hypothetical protein